MNEVTATSIIHNLFKKDLLDAVTNPKQGKEVIVKDGKIKLIAHSKIMKGDLSKFKATQDSIVISINNVAKMLQNEKTVPGGNEKMMKKLYEATLNQLYGPEDKKRIAKEMESYACQLSEAISHRQGGLKLDMGVHDSEVFSHMGVTDGQIDKKLIEQYVELKTVSSLAQDISRNAVNQHKVIILDATGRDITPSADNVYEFIMDLLGNSMVCLGLKTEGQVTQKVNIIKERFFQIISESKDPDFNEFAELDPDELREPIEIFVKELKNSNDPEDHKLAFVLFSPSQMWVVVSGNALSTIAREVFGKERFSSGFSGTKQLHSQTQFTLKFGEDGSLSLEVKSGHTNKDYEEKQKEDYTCIITTVIKMDPRGSDDLKVETSLLLHHKPGKGQEIFTFCDALHTAGYSVATKGTMKNSLLERNALVANTLIDAIRKNLSVKGLFQIEGDKDLSQTIIDSLVKQSNAWDPEQLLTGIEMFEKKAGVHELVGALKCLLNGGFELIPEDIFYEKSKEHNIFPDGIEGATLEQVQNFVNLLPQENKSVIVNLCQLCNDNKMMMENIARELGASIAPSGGEKSIILFLKLMEFLG